MINASERIMVVSHIRPDGDGIGSLIGLGLCLEALGKEVQMISPDGVPGNLNHLEGSSKVRHQPISKPDVSIVLDCSDLERIGDVLDEQYIPDINIDHHITNTSFAKVNLIDHTAVATAEILAELIDVLGWPITKPIASALMMGIIMDTIGFRTSNITPKALRIAARLIELGADLPDLYQRGLVNRSFEAARLWGAGLVQLERDGDMVWTTLSLEDRVKANYPGNDDADLINILSSIEDVKLALIFLEQRNGKIKVSWRAQSGYDVSKIAGMFGGGGHPAAAGAEVSGTLEDVKKTVLQATQAALKSDPVTHSNSHDTMR